MTMQSGLERPVPSGSPRMAYARKLPLRTFVLETDAASSAQLRGLCDEDPLLELIGETTDSRTALRLIDLAKPDLLLLGADMDGRSGIELVRAMNEHLRPLIVLVSAREADAPAAFQIGAVDYLLRPFDTARFREAIARVRTRFEARFAESLRQEIIEVVRDVLASAVAPNASRTAPRLVFERDAEHFFVDPGDVETVTADGNYVQVKTGKDVYRTRGTLSGAESWLDSSVFMRIRRSVIVNTLKIRKAERWFHGEYVLTLESGQRVVTGREYRRRLLACLRNRPAG